MTPEVKACQTAGPGYCTRNGPPPDRRRNRSAARRNRRIRGYLSPTTDTSPCRRGPAAGQKRPFPHSSPDRGLPPDRCRSGRSAAPARCCHTRCRQTQPNPQARQRAPPARAWSPSPEAWVKGGQGPDRRPVGLFSQLRRLTCFPQAVRPVQNRCKCHCGGCRFRLHLLQRARTTSSSGIVCPEPAQSSRVRAAVSGVSSSTCTATVSQVVSETVPSPGDSPAERSLPSVEPPSACCHTLPSIFASIPRGPFGFHHKSVTVFSFGPGCDTLHIITPQQKGALMKRLLQFCWLSSPC